MGSTWGIGVATPTRPTRASDFMNRRAVSCPTRCVSSGCWADSGFGEEEFLEHLEVQHQRYIVALRLTAYVQRAIRGSGQCQWLDRGLEVAEVRVALSRGKGARCLIVIHQHVPTRPRAGGK